MINKTAEGIFPVLPTPFDQSGGIDCAAMARLTDFAISCGVAGVVFPGFASEVETLTPAERAELLATVSEVAGGVVPIIAGASADSPEGVVEHGRVAMKLGISTLMVQPPKALPAAQVRAFMAAVASEIPEARIILQNAPAPRGSDLSPDTILDLARAVPSIAYVKEETLPSGPSIEQVLAGRPDTLKAVIGGGGARYILDEYTRGASAAMPALEIADLHVALDAAWRAGDRAKARDIYVRTLPLLVLQAVYRMRLTKHVLIRRGVLTSANADVRAPTPHLDEAAIADIDANLRELGLLHAEGIVA